jgi:RecB family exonuclease
LTPLVADLRRALQDPASSADLRAAAAARLAELALLEHDGVRLVPAADPDRWWGALERTSGTEPLFPEDVPLRLSGSSLDGLTGCALKWFFAHEANGEPAKGSAVGFGSVIHALADDLVRRDTPPDLDALRARLDQVWSSLDFEARWQSRRERQAADEALVRLLHWHTDPARADRTLVGTEERFELEVSVGGRPVVLRGSMDRVELDDEGRVIVVDLKTMKNRVTKSALTEHVQLGVYQLAVREGAFDDHPDVPKTTEPGGAELVQLRLEVKGGGPLVQGQAALGADAPTWIDDVLAAGVERLVTENFSPDPVNGGCQFCPFTACCPAQDEGRSVL